MSDVILFHHALGLTDGVLGFADELRLAGHAVTVPDLYDGASFDTLQDGVAHAEALGFENVLQTGTDAATELPENVVFGGFSLGGLVAHKLAQTRPGAEGALLYHYGDVPLDTFGPVWPPGVPVQFHLSEEDEWRDDAIVEDFVRQAGVNAVAELFEYPGSAHLFTDSSYADFDSESATLVLSRTLDFLGRLAD